MPAPGPYALPAVRVRAVVRRRFFAAVDNGVVVGSRRTWCFYTHAVIHHGASGPFATFHLSTEGAKKGLQAFRDTAPDKRVVRTIETPTLLPVVLAP